MGPVMETRLFPLGLGADAYEITGIAARCDLVILSDRCEPISRVVRRNTGPVSTIFVSMRHPFEGLRVLVDDILPTLDGPVTIISGSADRTFPIQTDARFPDYPERLRQGVDLWLGRPTIRRWFAENLVGGTHPKFSPLPLGMVFKTESERQAFAFTPGAPLAERPLKAFCAHRVRAGAQWQVRRQVTDLALGPWSSFTTAPSEELTLDAFDEALRTHPFVLCVEGGGIDPSPKAWQALSCGAIPIIRRSALEAAYARLPVIVLEDWRAEALSEAALEAWRRDLAARFPQGALTDGVAERLCLEYWWFMITQAERETPLRG